VSNGEVGDFWYGVCDYGYVWGRERGEAVWASHLLDCGFLTKEAMLYV
jgi:hypothetical protein